LIAMGGERLQLDDYSEISALCTHPCISRTRFRRQPHLALVAQSTSQRLRLAASRRLRQSSRYLGVGFRLVRRVKLQRISRRTL
jgi:hypothetical protein